MADAPYLIALALLEQDGRRAMPLQGKSLREPIAADADPGAVGNQQVLELLLRIGSAATRARCSGSGASRVCCLSPCRSRRCRTNCRRSRPIGSTAAIRQP